MNTPPKDLIKSGEARKLLGVSPLKMRQLLNNGTLRFYPDRLDGRVKLVSKAEVLALKENRAEAA